MKTACLEIARCGRRVGSNLRRGQRWRLVVALVLMALTGALTNVPPILLGKLVDRFVDASMFQLLDAWPVLAVILASILVREALQVGRRYLVEDTCTRVEKDVRVATVRHLLHLDLGFFADRQAGSLHGRLNRSIEGLVKLIKLCFLDFLPSAFVAAFALGVVLYRAPLLGGAMALVVPIGFWIVRHQVASQKGIRITLLRGKEDIDGAVVELLGGIENVRALHTEDFETARVERVAERLRAKEIVHHLWMAGYDAAKYVNEGFFHVFVLGMSIWLATTHVISPGDILTYSMLFLGVMMPLRELHRILDEAHESSLRLYDLFDLMDLPEDRSFAPIVAPAAARPRGNEPAVSLSGLHFSYPGVREAVLNNFDLVVRAGEFIGICGPTGCGKSTLLKILLRLLHAQQGAVSLFGRDIASITREELAQKVGYVGQNAFLVSGTVFANIAYGMDDVLPEAVAEAARKANIHDEILAFPLGYDTPVGERGALLSGGQRQRVALARVFLRAPSLLILDEATAALDNLNERVVQTAIEECMVGRTVIAVAHRLTTLRNADRIIVCDKGGAVEAGTYHELLVAGGLFARLAHASMGADPAFTECREQDDPRSAQKHAHVSCISMAD